VGTLQPAASAGIALGLPADGCGVHLSAQILRYLAASSARQCGPCLFGLDELADVMDRVAAGRGRGSDLDRLDRIAGQVVGRGGCHHPDGALRMLGSALDVFAADVAMHRRGRRCLRRHEALVSLQEVA
jgi:NADH:ubiquinone oxidoreductase subunit F (NADH-binding)